MQGGAEHSDKLKRTIGFDGISFCFMISLIVLLGICCWGGSFDVVTQRFLHVGFVFAYARAFCYMSIGVFIKRWVIERHITRCLARYDGKLRKLWCISMLVIGVISQMLFPHSRLEYITVTVYIVAVVMAENISWGEGIRRLVGRLARYSYPIYAYQMVAIQEMGKAGTTGPENVIKLFLLSIGIGVVLDKVVFYLSISKSAMSRL